VDEASKAIMKEVAPVLKAAAHRPANTGRAAHEKFRQNIVQKMERLSQTYPFLDFSREKELMNRS
jgi:hypothetical protein